MERLPLFEYPKWALVLLNNIYEIERKLAVHGDPGNARRNVEKIKDCLESNGLFYEDPLGQPFEETRTDLEATITGEGTEDLVVVEVIKPIIRQGKKRELSSIVQRGIVVVESKR